MASPEEVAKFKKWAELHLDQKEVHVLRKLLSFWVQYLQDPARTHVLGLENVDIHDVEIMIDILERLDG